MLKGIGNGTGGNIKQLMDAAQKRSQEASARMADIAKAAGGSTASAGAGVSDPGSFASKITESVNEISESTRGLDTLPLKLANGEITDIHEVAAQLKQAQLSLKFALEVRNKFIDAYQEVMRMSV
jgi:flagellar hook-basal body complex protein FliE